MRPHRTAVATCMILGLFALAGCAAEEAPPATTTTPTAQATIVANAGPDQSVFVNTFVTLDGSKSTNAKGTGLTYNWTLLKPTGSATILSDPTAVTPTFRPDVAGQFPEVRLRSKQTRKAPSG